MQDGVGGEQRPGQTQKGSTSVTLTAVVSPSEGTTGLTYTWYRFLNDESRSLANSSIAQDLTEKYTGANSGTLSITELPAGQSFSYKVQVAASDGYKCFSESFTVSTCAHDGDNPLQHDGMHHWYVCGKCGAELDKAAHSGGTATCTAKAVCSTRQTAYGEPGSHTLTRHEAADAACTTPGNVEYWHCSVCNKNFSDSTGTGEITEIAIPALNHAWSHLATTDHLSRYLLVHAKQAMGFTDVSAGAYYYDAVLWAVEQGITGGTGGGKFSPDTPLAPGRRW